MSNDSPIRATDNRKYIRQSIFIADLPPIDVADAEAVKERGTWYFNYCRENNLKPGVEGLCLALGISRRTFSGWASGAHRPTTHTTLARKFKQQLECFLVQSLLDGRMFPTVGIFYLKQFHGYKDQFELGLSQGQPDAIPATSPEELAEKYDVPNVE